jgi:hypothetical protein
MSNLEYVTGKTWGILKLFLGLDIIILLIALIINVISKSMTVDLLSYVTYLIIICVPTLLFSLGLSFLLMLILRNHLGDMTPEESMNLILKNMKGTRDNDEFLISMNG